MKVVVGGPPCPGYSKAHQTPENQKLRKLLPICVKLAMDLEADVIIMENAQEANGQPELKSAQRDLETLGYSVQVDVVNAADYGVPQTRKRTILIATRGPWTFTWPSKVAQQTTVREALAATPVPAPGGFVSGVVEAHVESGHRGYAGKYRPVDLDSPAHTITCQPKETHIFQRTEGLFYPSVEELLRLQTFPPTFKFPDATGEGDKLKMIGNAVPPDLAAAVARGLSKH